MPTITDRQLGILRHALGTAQGGKPYRSHFVTGPGSDDYDDCCSLVDAGMMVRRPGSELTGGSDLFLVNDAGRAYSAAPTPAGEQS